MNTLLYASAPHPKNTVANLQSPFSWLPKRCQSCGLTAVRALLRGLIQTTPPLRWSFLLSRVKAPGRESLHNYIKVPEPVVCLCAIFCPAPKQERFNTAIAYLRIYFLGQSQHFRADSTSQDRRKPL